MLNRGLTPATSWIALHEEYKELMFTKKLPVAKKIIQLLAY